MCQVHPLSTIKLTPSAPRAGSRRRRWRVAVSTRAGGDDGTGETSREGSERAAHVGARGVEEAGGRVALTSIGLEVDEEAAASLRLSLEARRGRKWKASEASSGSAENNAASRATSFLMVERATANAASS
eukprot:3784957-Pleurochrysis_carterae.AAC.2